jgi:conserved oligomeric Golgi complex subunit 5
VPHLQNINLKRFYLSEFFKAFLHGKNDVEIHEKISQGLVVSEQLSKLTTGLLLLNLSRIFYSFNHLFIFLGIGLLDKELLKQVTDHYEDLISQATCIEKLEDILNVMQPHIQYLLIAVERLNSKIVEPYNKIHSQTRMLNNLHATSDLLRRGVRISQLIKRLQTHMKGGPQELTKAARVLCELGNLNLVMGRMQE